MKKSKSIFLVTLMATMLLSACSGKNNETESASPSGGASPAAKTNQKLQQVTLKIMIPGDRPARMDAIIAEAEKRMADTLNVKLNITFVPWADLAQKTQLTLASGESIDLIFDAPWLHLSQQIAAGSYEPLEGLLDKYGPNIVKARPQQMWDANKFSGKIYGIPLGASHFQGRGYYVRKDIREKLGIAPIKTYDDLIKFAYAVKEKVPGITPLLPAGQDGLKDMSEAVFRRFFDTKTHLSPSPVLTQSLVLYTKNNDGKVHNLFDEIDPTIWSWIKNARKLYQDGIIGKDVLAVKDLSQPAKEGKVAIFDQNNFGIAPDIQSAVKQNDPNAEFESVTFFDATPKANISNFQQWNFISVPVVSKNKERAIQFLDWANQKDNYDLLTYGIKGEDWEPVGDDQYKSMSKGYAWFPFAWIMNPLFDRLDANQDPETQNYNKYTKVADNFTTDILTGFTFDNTPVANEIAQYNTIESKYYTAIMNGVVDPDSNWLQFKTAASGLAKKIQTEEQKQIDAFLSKK
ncbi:extracellular solute-binding protein [Paenibacillus sp. LMG 31458]|uniref:Extracellular solute-binding protein n=1 Tax=Paenibacillus phytorum TaxID=2654977 RepID=A0ABX1XXB4_9BACL|nr:extracellular solute-binding protein [Paenibacillus phytorum]NOU73019.1 extracellular solute-binding protein [Paenibacillus phytorum]